MVSPSEQAGYPIHIVVESDEFVQIAGYPPIWVDMVYCDSFEEVGDELVITSGKVRRQHGNDHPLMPWDFQKRMYRLREVSTYTVIRCGETLA